MPGKQKLNGVVGGLGSGSGAEIQRWTAPRKAAAVLAPSSHARCRRIALAAARGIAADLVQALSIAWGSGNMAPTPISLLAFSLAASSPL